MRDRYDAEPHEHVLEASSSYSDASTGEPKEGYRGADTYSGSDDTVRHLEGLVRINRHASSPRYSRSPSFSVNLLAVATGLQSSYPNVTHAYAASTNVSVIALYSSYRVSGLRRRCTFGLFCWFCTLPSGTYSFTSQGDKLHQDAGYDQQGAGKKDALSILLRYGVRPTSAPTAVLLVDRLYARDPSIFTLLLRDQRKPGSFQIISRSTRGIWVANRLGGKRHSYLQLL